MTIHIPSPAEVASNAVNSIAAQQGIVANPINPTHGDAVDAFRHVYTTEVLKYGFSQFLPDDQATFAAYTLGAAVEIVNSHNYGDSMKSFRDYNMDTYNDELGAADHPTSLDDAAQRAKAAVQNGDAINSNAVDDSRRPVFDPIQAIKDGMHTIKDAIDNAQAAIDSAAQAALDGLRNLIDDIFGTPSDDDHPDNSCPVNPHIGGPNDGPGSGSASGAFNGAETAVSPLIIDMGGNGFHFNNIATSSNAYFDLTGNHFATHTSWDTGADGFLARDTNADGKINDITELFGDNGGTSAWAKLAALDSNASGTITSADTAFSSLRVWVDANHNGHTDAGELQTLATAGITSITLQQNSNNSTVDGQTLSGNATATIGGVARTMTDAFFTNDVIDSWWIGDGTSASTTVDSQTLFLPLSRGYGTLASWPIAMTQDSTLLTLAEQIRDFSSPELQQLDGMAVNFLFEWAGGGGVDPASRGGPDFDARKLEFLEKELGTSFNNINNSNPHNPYPGVGGAQIVLLTQAWNSAFWEFHDRLVVQGPLSGIFLNEGYDFTLDRLVFGDTLSAITARAASLAPAYSDIEHFLSYWSEVGGILTRHAADFSQTSAQVAAAVDSAAGHHVPITNNLTVGTPGVDNLVVFTNADHFITLQAGNDTVQAGGTGVAYIMGEDGDYLSWAGAASGTLDGGAGADNLTGGAGNDLLIGGTGNDYMLGSSGGDIYVWGSGGGNDTIYDNGEVGWDNGKDVIQLTNLNAADVSYSIDNFNDLTIKANATNETVFIQYEFNTGVGANFVETLKFADGSTMDLALQGFNFTAPLNGFVYGGYGNDTLNGSTGAETLFGNKGDDLLQGNNGNDTLDGGVGNNLLQGGAGNDRYVENLVTGTDVIIESSGTDTVAFGAGITSSNISFFQPGNSNDLYVSMSDGGVLVIRNQFAAGGAIETFSFSGGSSLTAAQVSSMTTHPAAPPAGITVTGGAGNDNMVGDLGSDLLLGQGGNDTYIINPFTGNDTVNDASGTDTVMFGEGIDPGDVAYSQAGNDFILSVHTGQVITIVGQFASTPVEAITFMDGTTIPGADFQSLTTAGTVVNGTGSAESLYGGSGPDTINAGGGNDVAVGNDGYDQVYGGTGNDSLWGSNGNDTLSGDDGDDQLNGDAGNDSVSGGIGNDSLWGGTGNDTITGDAGNDALYGNDGNDALIGGDGADWLEGDNGDDVLKGNAGADGLMGGGGNDIFLYTALTDSPVGTDDWIYDFAHGQDKLSLSTIAEHITFIGTSAFSGLGSAQLHQFASGGNTVLELDADGNGTADMQFVLVGSIPFAQSDMM
jgi:Ca2+-binding RTX toxin-like protein